MNEERQLCIESIIKVLLVSCKDHHHGFRYLFSQEESLLWTILWRTANVMKM